jgi:hypothetical protein
MPTGAGYLYWVGNQAAPVNVILQTVNRTAFQVSGAGQMSMSGFTFASSGSNPADPCAGIFLDRVRLSMSDVRFSNCSGYMVGVTRGAALVMSGNWTIAGNSTGNPYASGGFLSCFFSAIVESSPAIAPLYFNCLAAFTLAYFVQSSQFGALNLTWTSFTGFGNITGTRYLASLNGVISSGGGGVNYYPGTIAGSVSNGGQYA